MISKTCIGLLVAGLAFATAGAGTAQSQPAALSLDEAVAGEWRPDSDTVRDQWRHPRETLAFFGLDPAGKVAEVMPMGGYYARILLPWLAAHDGVYVAVIGSTTGQPIDMEAEIAALREDADRAGARIDIQPALFTADSPELAAPGSLDAVLTFRNVHNWMMGEYADKAFADFYAALKPGGVLGLVEHRLPEGASIGNTGRTGYVRPSHVIALAEAAGFVLEAQSEINANPADDADHPVGVWTLAPARAAPRPDSPDAEGFDRAQYDAIGESDRMTLRFRKPLD